MKRPTNSRLPFILACFGWALALPACSAEDDDGGGQGGSGAISIASGGNGSGGIKNIDCNKMKCPCWKYRCVAGSLGFIRSCTFGECIDAKEYSAQQCSNEGGVAELNQLAHDAPECAKGPPGG